jgi:hypothetical protein
MLMAMKICDLNKSDDTPHDFPTEGNPTAKSVRLNKLVEEIVAACWEEPEKEKLLLAAGGHTAAQNTPADDISVYCTCGKGEFYSSIKYIRVR